MAKQEIIIDGTKAVLGRLATVAAKKALQNNDAEIIVVNCNDIIIIGKPASILAHWKKKRALGGTAQKGPYIQRKTNMFVRRTIRGMLPYKKTRGIEAFRRIKCYEDTPEKYKDKEKIKMESNAIKFMVLSRLSKLM